MTKGLGGARDECGQSLTLSSSIAGDFSAGGSPLGGSITGGIVGGGSLSGVGTGNAGSSIIGSGVSAGIGMFIRSPPGPFMDFAESPSI